MSSIEKGWGRCRWQGREEKRAGFLGYSQKQGRWQEQKHGQGYKWGNLKIRSRGWGQGAGVRDLGQRQGQGEQETKQKGYCIYG